MPSLDFNIEYRLRFCRKIDGNDLGALTESVQESLAGL